MKSIVLASKSIDRAKLFRNAKIPFDILVTDINEEPYKKKYVSNPTKLVVELAKAKALNAVKILAQENKDYIVIAADTIVELNGEIIGKAINEEQAFQIFKKLAGKTHNLVTGVAITETTSNKKVFTHEITAVKFLELSDDEIRNYIRVGEWKGRAGAYSISERASLFIESINGSSSNVVGLPLHSVYEILKNKFNFDLLQDWEFGR